MAGIERRYECWQQGLERPSAPQPGESFEVSLRYLLSTAAACSWFTEQQYEKIEGWLEDVVGLREERRLRSEAEKDSRGSRDNSHGLRLQLDVAVDRAVAEA